MNPMKYYVDGSGVYLGGWDDNPPTGAIEVSVAPESASQVWDFDNAAWIMPSPSLADAKAAKLADLDEYRWQVEVGGADFGGVTIRTDLNSQAKVTAAWAMANADPDYAIPTWEVAPGVFMPLSNAQILTMAAAVRDHIQETFNRKAVLYPMIQALETVDEVTGFDIAAEWDLL